MLQLFPEGVWVCLFLATWRWILKLTESQYTIVIRTMCVIGRSSNNEWSATVCLRYLKRPSQWHKLARALLKLMYICVGCIPNDIPNSINNLISGDTWSLNDWPELQLLIVLPGCLDLRSGTTMGQRFYHWLLINWSFIKFNKAYMF